MAKVTKTSKTKPSHPKILKMFRRRKILVKKRILLKLNLKELNTLPIHWTVPFFRKMSKKWKVLIAIHKIPNAITWISF